MSGSRQAVVSRRDSAASNRWRALAAAFCLLLAIQFSPAAAEEPHRAGLVARFDDGRTETACVSFAEEQISGYELLNRSGLAVTVEVQGIGALVCAIEETGCPASDCLCQCRGGECVYWSYWRQENEAWRYSAGGAGISAVRPGMVDGWSWGPSSVNAAIPPPLIAFAEICGETAVAPPASEPAAAPGNWLPYLLFLLIIGGLGLRLMLSRRRGAPSDL